MRSQALRRYASVHIWPVIQDPSYTSDYRKSVGEGCKMRTDAYRPQRGGGGSHLLRRSLRTLIAPVPVASTGVPVGRGSCMAPSELAGALQRERSIGCHLRLAALRNSTFVTRCSPLGYAHKHRNPRWARCLQRQTDTRFIKPFPQSGGAPNTAQIRGCSELGRTIDLVAYCH